LSNEELLQVIIGSGDKANGVAKDAIPYLWQTFYNQARRLQASAQ